jgi:hypothetical protein
VDHRTNQSRQKPRGTNACHAEIASQNPKKATRMLFTQTLAVSLYCKCGRSADHANRTMCSISHKGVPADSGFYSD